jgi:hypothetical protein
MADFGGWPTQSDFWLEWSGSKIVRSLSTKGRDRQKAYVDLRLGRVLPTSRTQDVGHPLFFSFGCLHLTSYRGWNCCSQTEQVPGIAVFLEVRAVLPFCALWIEADVGKGRNLKDGDDVPSIVSDHVGGEEIDLLRGIWNDGFVRAVASHGNAVSPAGGGENRFHLNAKHAAVVLDDQVVGFTVTVGFADGESHAGGFDHEDQFRHHAFAFGIQSRESDGLALAARLGRSNRIFCHKRCVGGRLPGALFSLFELNLVGDSQARAPAPHKTCQTKQKARAGCLRLFLVSIFRLSDSKG